MNINSTVSETYITSAMPHKSLQRLEASEHVTSSFQTRDMLVNIFLGKQCDDFPLDFHIHMDDLWWV